jgi:hypothetical protein
VIVGVTEARADARRIDAPTVYDYGSMGPKNLVALDFVKLETEIKVRAYDLIFDHDPRDPSEFVRSVHEFETRLAALTRDYAEHGWATPAGGDRAGRLLAIVLEIRKCAYESMRGAERPADWLDEYFLCLATYSALPSRFDDYRRRPPYRLAVAVGGDVAASRVEWVRVRRRAEAEVVEELARRDDVAGAEGDATAYFGRGLLGSEAVLELTHRWWQAGGEARRAAAHRLLESLQLVAPPDRDAPFGLAIWQERLLLYMDTAPHAAEQLLANAERQHPDPTEELGCRFGRWRKEWGDRHREGGRTDLARVQYHRALGHYRQAYERWRNGYYPGVNVAALHLLIAATFAPAAAEERGAELRQVEEFARRVLDSRCDWPVDRPEDRTVWHPATVAEFHLLRRAWDEAEPAYRAIPAEPGHQRTIGRQIRRIAAAWQSLGVDVPEPFYSFDPDHPETLFAAAR